MLVVTGNGTFCEECKASNSARRSLHCGKPPLFKTALRLKRKNRRQGGQETECGFQDVLQSQLHVAGGLSTPDNNGQRRRETFGG